MMMMRTEEWEEYRYVLLLKKSIPGLEPDSGQGMCRSCAHTSPITLLGEEEENKDGDKGEAKET